MSPIRTRFSGGLRFSRLSWVQRSLLVGALLSVLWTVWDVQPQLRARVLRDGIVFIVVPVALATTHGRRLGWRVDPTVLRNTALLALFVLPFYLVGSTFPTVRAYYPMWETSPALSTFAPHAVGQFLVAAAAETYYRGLLCVGVRDVGFKSVFISPVLYALHHVGKPPVELLLSGPTDVLFGAVDYRSDSILPSVVAHGVGLCFLDWLVLHPPLLPPDRTVSWFSWLPLPL